MEVRPIIGWRDPQWEFIVNPIIDFAIGAGGSATKADHALAAFDAVTRAEKFPTIQADELWVEPLARTNRSAPYPARTRSSRSRPGPVESRKTGVRTGAAGNMRSN
jgi:hypothetical protein